MVPEGGEPAADQRRLILAGLDPTDVRTLDGQLTTALSATGAVTVSLDALEEVLDEVRRSREAGAFPAVLAGARFSDREMARLARGLGNRQGVAPLVALVSAPLEELIEAALAEGCCDVLVRGRTTPDDLVRALRCSFEASRRERAEARLKIRLLEPTAPAALLAEARRFVGLGRTAAAASHDLNNLLQPILGYSELLLGTLEADTRAANYARHIERSAQLAIALVRRVLSIGRDGDEPLAPWEGDRRLEEMRDLIGWVTGSTVELKLEPGAPGTEILLRDGVLEQVVLNLAANARDAMPSGGVLALRSRLEDDGAHWTLEVEDAGAGIPTADLERLFEPGYTTKPKGKGTGLGLWIVRGLVEEAGGRVHVESTPGQGTRVRVRVPVAKR
jgi:signal transduction histidine kinase